MDINTIRGILTLVLFLGFSGLCYWVYSPSQKERFEKAGRLPFTNGEKLSDE